MRSGSRASSTAVCIFVLSVVVPAPLAITTTHHDKPEAAQPIRMASRMRAEGGDPSSVSFPSTTTADLAANASSPSEAAERQKRLLPYMTFYLEQDFNRPHGQQQHVQQQLPSLAPTNYATTGAVQQQQPTILQQYHNKFTELTNGISYRPATADKARLTPFSYSNALPGPFLPMRNAPPQLQPPPPPPSAKPPITSGSGDAAYKQPNYDAIYDKLSQLKLQQQYQLAQTYARQHPPQQQQQQVLQLQVAHPHQNSANYRQQQQPQQQVQVSYIPIRDYSALLGHKQQSPAAKTIVQTYTPASIDIPAASFANEHDDDDDDAGNAVTDEDALREDDDARYEPEHVRSPHQHHHHHHQHHHHRQQQQQHYQQHHASPPVKSYNEPVVKHYGARVQPPNADAEYKFPVDVVERHVLEPVILVRQKSPAAAGSKPYLLLRQPYDYELRVPETPNFRPPIKLDHPPPPTKHQPQQRGKIVVETAAVTPKYVEVKPPTLLTYSSPNYDKPFEYSVQASGPSAPSAPPSPIRTVLPQDLSRLPRPPTPRPHVASYQQRPTSTHHEGQRSQVTTTSPREEEAHVDYVESEDVTYRPPLAVVRPEYADELSEDDVAAITTRAPEPVHHHRPGGGKYAHTLHTHDATNYVQDELVYVTTPAPTTPEPEYHEGANSLSLILKKLQDTNALPRTLTPENIDNSIRTLVKILSGLKKTPTFRRPIVVRDDLGDYVGDNEAGVGLGEVPGTVTQIFPDNTPEGGTPGTPGVDYPALSSIPPTSFNCKTQRYKGFFGDPDTHCQVWHYCDLNGGQASFLCPNGTIFSQVALTCDWWYNVKCSNTAQLYVLNERLYKYILPLAPKFPEDYSGPLVDRYLALKFQEMEEKMQKERKPNKEHAATMTHSKGADDASAVSSTRANDAVQDDAEELSKETRRHEAALAGSSTASPNRSAPIVVPDESNETTTSTEHDDDAS